MPPPSVGHAQPCKRKPCAVDENESLDSFEALLQTAMHQHEPQRLLLVFARRSLGEHASAWQRERFARGEGGHLEPCLCVDKAPEEITGFAALRAESEQTGVDWDVMFVSSLSGRGGIPPSSDEADQPLRFMLKAIGEGGVTGMAAFDRTGTALRFLDSVDATP